MTAAEYREYTLACDYWDARREVGCGKHFGPSGQERSRAELRKLAAKQGWAHVRSVSGRKYDDDFCPAHKPAESTNPKVEARDGQ